ncbi:hypothetical protein BZG36_03264 [Bifiguratus adelaidae]|uniref:PX domain-containing protein n=1 Tax=Bifiguratus adelaidae TaxID=1938954 RepID=A0A261XXF9_9FUNG|nr:hypothetical protein BZG36_03264 [Bifiguratus adelaidae]
MATVPDWNSEEQVVKPTCNCQIDRVLIQREGPFVIKGAQKQSDSVNSASYVVYVIAYGTTEVKRRYSEFESLRKALCRLHPTLIIPPIPEKHSLTDYATMQNRVKDDPVMIEKRKRMLQRFLNRMAKHPELGHEHVFHRFLEPGTTWSEIANSPPLNSLPKHPLHLTHISGESSVGAQSSPTQTSSNSTIPIPSSTQTLRNPDMRFTDSEVFTNKFSNQMSNGVEKAQKKIMRRLGDYANDYAELGAVYNAFSLNETDKLANAIERVGQAVDCVYTETGKMINALEANVAEPIQEYVQYSSVIKAVLKYRYLKQAQLELVEDTLEQKRTSYAGLQRVENEARRLDEALSRSRVLGQDNTTNHQSPSLTNPDNTEQRESNGTPESEEENQAEGYNSDITSPAVNNNNPYKVTHTANLTKRRGKRWSAPTKIFTAMSHTIQGIIDVDPEATRRNQLGKTKDSITHLEEALEILSQDIKSISVNTQQDLDRFQRQKIQDLRDMLIEYAKIHRDWCQTNYDYWKDTKVEVNKIVGED